MAGGKKQLSDAGVVYYVMRRYLQADEDPSIWVFPVSGHRDEFLVDFLARFGVETDGRGLNEAVDEFNDSEADVSSVLSFGDIRLQSYNDTVSELRQSSRVDDLCRATRSLISALRSKRLNDGDRMRIAEAEAVIRTLEES
jgi:hypothetical protein